MRKTTGKRLGAALAALALGASLAACGGSDDSGSGEDSKTITMGIIPSWTDGLSTAYLWQNLLEKEGYTVEIEEINDAGPLYTALAEGDVDVYPSAWPEVTHAQYMDEFGDDIEDIGQYYEGASLNLSVPKYSKLKSIEDLKGKAADYDGEIVGIEAGSGLHTATEEDVLPAYELDDEWTAKPSKTDTMLQVLSDAIDKKEDVVVELWTPFWANSTYPVRALEDPKGAFGESEALHELGREGFKEDFPDVAAMMEKAKMDVDQYGTLEKAVTDDLDNPEAGVEKWLKENQDWVESLG